MKKSYIKLIIFQIVFVVFFILSSFVVSTLSNYCKILLLILMLVGFKLLFGFERERKHYVTTICIEVLIWLLVYFILYYLSGIFMSFTKTIGYMRSHTIIHTILPLIVIIVLKEILRFNMIRKSELSKLLLIINCLFFIIFDLTLPFKQIVFNSRFSFFIYIAVYVLPTISKNVFCSYVAYKCSYKPAIIYLLALELYSYILPIYPNPSMYIYSIIQLVLPVLFMYRVYLMFLADEDEDLIREYHKKKLSNLVFPIILTFLVVYFTSGYFRYLAIAVASGSMETAFSRGDVVVVEKTENKKDIEIGEVIAYYHNKKIVVHRLFKKIKVESDVVFYTKGDANEKMDNYKITEDMVIGIVKVKVPFMGYPTVWINEL